MIAPHRGTISASHFHHRGTHLYIVNVVEIRVLHFFDVTLRNSTGKSVNTTVAALRCHPSRRARRGDERRLRLDRSLHHRSSSPILARVFTRQSRIINERSGNLLFSFPTLAFFSLQPKIRIFILLKVYFCAQLKRFLSGWRKNK